MVDFELFFFSAAQLRDLAALSSMPDWREKSRFAVCWLQELWADDISDRNRMFDLLEQFDHVICPFYHSLEPLQKRLMSNIDSTLEKVEDVRWRHRFESRLPR